MEKGCPKLGYCWLRSLAEEPSCLNHATWLLQGNLIRCSRVGGLINPMRLRERS